MSREDLTLREVAEASTFGLQPEDYDRLKTTLRSRYRDQVYRECREQAAAESLQAQSRQEQSLRSKIRDELRTEVSKNLEESFEKDRRIVLRKEIEAEIAEGAPTQKQRESARTIIREIEMDALAMARAASDLEVETEARTRDSDVARKLVFYGLFLSAFPTLAYLYAEKGWGLVSIPFLAVAIPLVVAIFGLGGSNEIHSQHRRKRVLDYRLHVEGHRNLAARAKEARLVRVDMASTKAELTQLVSSLKVEWPRYGDAPEVQIPVSRVEQARIRVREDLVSDMDPEKLFRVDSTDQAFEDMEAAERVTRTSETP